MLAVPDLGACASFGRAGPLWDCVGTPGERGALGGRSLPPRLLEPAAPTAAELRCRLPLTAQEYMERRGTPVTRLVANGVAESAAASASGPADSGTDDPVELDSTGGGGGVGPQLAGGADGEVGVGPRDPRRPWAGTKPALKPLSGISDEQASMPKVPAWWHHSLTQQLGDPGIPRPHGCEAPAPGCSTPCEGARPAAQIRPIGAACGAAAPVWCVPPIAAHREPVHHNRQARRIREAVRKNKRPTRQDED